MADFIHSIYSSSFRRSTLSLYALTLTLTLTPMPVSSSLLRSPTPTFDPDIALCGDAELSGSGSRVVLTPHSGSSSGLLLLRKPFRLMDPKLANPTSFSTEFAFSLSNGNADGISLVLVSGNSTSKQSGECSLGISEENTFPVVLNASSPANEEKFRSWIDYDASSKRLEVRLAKSSESRPYNPVFVYAVDFPKMWRDGEVVLGIASSNATVYDWSFRLRNFPNSLHSLPVDPRAHPEHGKPKRVCPLAILGGLIFATVCGALMAFSVLFLWAVVTNHHSPIPVEQSRLNSAGFRYEKIGVVVEKDGDSLKN